MCLRPLNSISAIICDGVQAWKVDEREKKRQQGILLYSFYIFITSYWCVSLLQNFFVTGITNVMWLCGVLCVLELILNKLYCPSEVANIYYYLCVVFIIYGQNHTKNGVAATSANNCVKWAYDTISCPSQAPDRIVWKLILADFVMSAKIVLLPRESTLYHMEVHGGCSNTHVSKYKLYKSWYMPL